ncbi:MAG: hypothetical protein E5Y79_16080 [Mesorhizobium sp.]|uniref:MerR family transcriptional regulator n=1 Tax=Mesorhizobium sp. TaxID=1871066 RepID=UPI00120D3E3C|nr:MerR family transcriptional regulator [Mesorhizobium sp.]TIL59253.1 MAG: hypothetical protein E5Y79_16080 [Mesorhizobium sp.]
MKAAQAAIDFVEQELVAAEANVIRLRAMLAKMREHEDPVDEFAGGAAMLEVTEAASRFGLSEDTIRFWARTYNCGKKDVVTGRWLVSVERIKARINSRKRR